ncbi:MAG: DMT family transporter [Synergistaceae bacterium]|nr:DMT family transporter [Synergistaceae bacterium]
MRRFAVPALTIGIFAVSTGPIFARLSGAPPLATAAYRLIMASLILAPFAFVYRRHEIARLDRKELLYTFAAGAFLAVHFGTWITSLSYTSVASSVVLVNTLPIWVGLAAFLTGEKLSKLTWAALAISVVGGFLVGYGDFSMDPRALWGDCLALIGGIAVSGYVILGRKIRQKLSLLAYISLCYGTAAILLMAANLLSGGAMSGFSPYTWLMFLGIAVVPQLVGHSCYNWALGYFSAEFIAVALLGEPIGSSIMAYFLFDEFPTPIMFAGFAFLMFAIVIATIGEQK